MNWLNADKVEKESDRRAEKLSDVVVYIKNNSDRVCARQTGKLLKLFSITT